VSGFFSFDRFVNNWTLPCFYPRMRSSCGSWASGCTAPDLPTVLLLMPVGQLGFFMSRRGQIRKLAKTDTSTALKLVPSLSNVDERIQALGWVARYAKPKEVLSIIDSAVATATEYAQSETDLYAPAMALAWPLRALHETGNLDSMARVRDIALEWLQSITPCSSRTDCHAALIHATIPAGISVANPIVDSMIAHCTDDAHWRVVRAFVDSALLVNGFHKVRSLELAAVIADEKKREVTISQLQTGEANKPRVFFW